MAAIGVIMIVRRTFLAWLASLVVAPAVVHAENIMPVRKLVLPPDYELLVSDYILPYDVVLRLGGGDGLQGTALLDRWVAGVRSVIEAERRMKPDLREVLDSMNNRLGGWDITGDVSIAMTSRTKQKFQA